jgi:hypothetical protein
MQQVRIKLEQRGCCGLLSRGKKVSVQSVLRGCCDLLFEEVPEPHPRLANMQQVSIMLEQGGCCGLLCEEVPES